MEEEHGNLATLRKTKKSGGFASWLRGHCPYLFRWDSLFYFGLFTLVIAFGWIGYSLFSDSFTQLLNWDYTWQYVPFTYTYWDAWHVFYSSGHFPMYDATTWIGTDAIGSNSYYGLFDPFIVLMTFFPRSWIPQMFAVMTAFKIVTATFLARAYFKYLGIKEWTARFAALAVGLSGYVSFFVGFPSFVSAACYIPMILWGIERVIKEKKIGVLVWGLFLEGITSFFFLVVACVFGVIYALWRFFWTLKTRGVKDNWAVIGLGIASFAIGLCLSGFSLFPSLRETMLSGRSSSVGKAYLSALITSLKEVDFRTFFGLIFEEVGDNPGREIMALLSFFFPTGGHIALPLARGGYDAWTSSIFLYTPFVILLFYSFIQSIRLRRWDHLFAALGIFYLLFTNLAYFLFYAFSGNGYGRWFIVLLPIIAYYGAWGFDQRETSPKWVPIAATLMAILGTVIVFYFTDFLLKDQSFSRTGANNPSYWVSSYVTATDTYNGNIFNAWYLYYQLALLVVEGVLFILGQKKSWLPKAFTVAIAVEAIVMGNLAYLYDGTWSYQYSFGSGVSNVQVMTQVAEKIKASDSSYYRVYGDFFGGTKYNFKVAGLNGSADFHSLMNFEVEDFALSNRMKTSGSFMSGYGEESIYNPSWAGYYANKRMGTDTAIGYRYYETTNYYSAWKNEDGTAFFPTANVPFGSVEVEDASPNRDYYRVYRVDEAYRPQLGYAVDGSRLYRLKHIDNSPYKTNFRTDYGDYMGFADILRMEDVEMNGATIDEGVEVPSGFTVMEDAPALSEYTTPLYRLGNGKIKTTYYEVGGGDLMVPSSSHDYYREGLGFFLKHNTSKKTLSGSALIQRDSGMVAATPTEPFVDESEEEDGREYFNSSKDGVYIELNYYNNDSNNRTLVPRVYLIGTSYDEDGRVKKYNDLLSFEYCAFLNAKDTDSNYTYYGYYTSSFGLYAKGRVKAVVFCYTGSSDANKQTIRFDPTNIAMHIEDYADWAKRNEKIQAGAFQNVQTYTNYFTFDTAYGEPRICVTQLGYDKGWQATAKHADGRTEKCQMLKLDGGLVGFVAPSDLSEDGTPQTISYELRYQTPYSNYASIAWVIGMGAFLGYLGLNFHFRVKKEKEEIAKAPKKA